jgi:DNA-binding MarR family transcriptional regulator
MASLRIEILNPKALKLIKGMEELNLIKVSIDSTDKLKTYLRKTRKKADKAPSLEEITRIVEEVRSERYDGK